MTSDQELKLALCGMLPEYLSATEYTPFGGTENVASIRWKSLHGYGRGELVQDTEWLHICHLVEKKFFEPGIIEYREVLSDICKDETRNGVAISASWQQRAAALIKAKGV